MISKSAVAKKLLLEKNCRKCLYGYRTLGSDTLEYRYLCMSHPQDNGGYEDISSDYTCPDFYNGLMG